MPVGLPPIADAGFEENLELETETETEVQEPQVAQEQKALPSFLRRTVQSARKPNANENPLPSPTSKIKIVKRDTSGQEVEIDPDQTEAPATTEATTDEDSTGNKPTESKEKPMTQVHENPPKKSRGRPAKNPAAANTTADAAAPAPKRRGRPPGSKNKPKENGANGASTAATTAPATAPAPKRRGRKPRNVVTSVPTTTPTTPVELKMDVSLAVNAYGNNKIHLRYTDAITTTDPERVSAEAMLALVDGLRSKLMAEIGL